MVEHEATPWMVIPSFPGYEISHEGMVRDRYNQHMLATNNGSVKLQKGAKRYSRSVQRLLDEAMMGIVE